MKKFVNVMLDWVHGENGTLKLFIGVFITICFFSLLFVGSITSILGSFIQILDLTDSFVQAFIVGAIVFSVVTAIWSAVLHAICNTSEE